MQLKQMNIPVNNAKRHKVWCKTKGKCWYCGASFKQRDMTIDHVHPISKNHVREDRFKTQINNITNLVPCCITCNRDKGNLILEDFRYTLGVNYVFWFERNKK